MLCNLTEFKPFVYFFIPLSFFKIIIYYFFYNVYLLLFYFVKISYYIKNVGRSNFPIKLETV